MPSVSPITRPSHSHRSARTRRRSAASPPPSTEPVECSALAARTDVELSAPTISHHYRILREAGLTRTVADGRKRIVRVRRDDPEKRFPGLLDAVLTSD